MTPTTWQALFGEHFRGRTRFERSFGCPTGIRPGDNLTLVIQGFERPLGIRLNGAALNVRAADEKAFACDVSELLLPRNVLSIEVEFTGDADHACPIGEAELVIQCAE